MILELLVKKLVEAITTHDPSSVHQAIYNIVHSVRLQYESFPIGNILKCNTSVKFSGCDEIFFIKFKNGNWYNYENLWDSRSELHSFSAGENEGLVKLDDKEFFERMLKDITAKPKVVDLTDDEIDNMKNAMLAHEVIHWYRTCEFNVNGYSTSDIVRKYFRETKDRG